MTSIDTELRTAAEWEENWGFLKAPRRIPRGNGQAKMNATHSGAFSNPGSQAGSRRQSPAGSQLGATGRQVLERPASGEVQPTNASVDPFCDPDRPMDDRSRVLNRFSKAPKDRFLRPVTTTQEVGWRPSLEKFGVCHHGIRRNQELWPEM